MKHRSSLGGRLKAIISGGATLPLATDVFFDKIGLQVNFIENVCACTDNLGSFYLFLIAIDPFLDIFSYAYACTYIDSERVRINRDECSGCEPKSRTASARVSGRGDGREQSEDCSSGDQDRA